MTETVRHDSAPPYRQAVDAVISALATDARRGLSEDEARVRLERYGRNELTAEEPVPGWKKFLAQFKDVLVILLLVATAISAGLWLMSATRRCPTRRSRSSPSCCSTRSWATSRSRAPSRRWRRCARCRRARDGHSRRRTAKHSGGGGRARRHHPHRRRRHHSGRRAPDSVDRAANGGSGAHGREPAGVEGHRRLPEKPASATATT